MHGAIRATGSAIRRAGAITALVQLILPVVVARAADDAAPFFGQVQAACPTKEACDELRKELLKLDACSTLEVECKPANRIFEMLFGKSFQPGLPDFIVYFDQQTVGRGTFSKHEPRLMWKGKVTPHLDGVREVYAIVLTEHRACLDGHVTTHYKSEPNPFSAVLAVLGSKQEAAAPKASERTSADFHWYPLSGKPNDPRMWLAMARFGVDVNSASRITIEYSQPRKVTAGERAQGGEALECPGEKAEAGKDGGKGTKKAVAAGNHYVRPVVGGIEGFIEVAVVPDVMTKEAADTSLAEKYNGDFLAVNGIFSNSSSSYATMALALGISFKVNGTSVASGGSSQAFNGYAMAKVYLLRPQVRAEADRPGRGASVGVAFGTGVKAPFDEFVFALSLGHVIGSAGFLAGGNYIAGAKDSTNGRKWCPFFGMDYSF
jgi:hypothetical protein